jgi:hypothetical protein
MIRLEHGDCKAVLATLADNSVDSIVTDPPYELGFMGKKWDGSGIAYDVGMWAQCLRVLKPGGHLLSFGATRTYHRMACAVEDAGFEIRDSIMWIYGSGFPKGSGVLKPAHEPIVVARKPIAGTVAANVLAHGTGSINIETCRIAGEEGFDSRRNARGGDNGLLGEGTFKIRERRAEDQAPREGRWPANIVMDEAAGAELDQQEWATVGQPSRFFYCPKAGAKERPKLADGTAHPTVKPLALMQWLVRLVTPSGGVVLDPFAGSGATLEAARLEGFDAIGIEMEAKHCELIRARLGGSE